MTVCSRLRDGPSSTTRPASIESWTEATISCSPSSATRRSRNSITSAKLWPVSTCRIGHGNGAGPERLLGQPQQHDRVLAAAEEQDRALELGGDLAHHVDGLGLERLELGEGRHAAASRVASPSSASKRSAQPFERDPDWRRIGGGGAGTPARISIVGDGSRAKSS